MSIKNAIEVWYQTTRYRLGQVRQQLGFVEPLTREDRQEVQLQLPALALSLFDTMSNADQQHSLRVCRGLQAQGCIEQDMLAAALLHDVGKAQGRVPFWTRPVIVLGKLCAPRLLAQVVLPVAMVGTDLSRPRSQSICHQDATIPSVGTDLSRPRSQSICHQDAINRSLQGMRRALSYAWWHADIGADLAAQAGLSERAVLYIRTHHEPHGPAATLHRIDEVS